MPTKPADCPCADRFCDWVSELVHAHRAQLAGLARRQGLGAEDAFDVVQEAFSALLVLPRARALVDAPAEARLMLVALVRNLARNARRLHAVARPHVSESAALTAMVDAAPTAEQRLLLGQEQHRLAQCVARLADVQRAVVTLRMLDERPGQDVARMMGIPPGHVAVLLHRAKSSLRTCMSQPETEERDPP